MDKGQVIVVDNLYDDGINYEDDDYDDLFDDDANPKFLLYAMGSYFEKDEEGMEDVADAMVGIEGVVDASEGADMNAPESSNVTISMNIGTK